ncbi:O-antigen ligase family protein [Magnetospirillum molischianum]|uniref:O-antigen ligase-related domain-containing protein n=1 Tax=Magnetospirillum molischianum DSM 120 TaxID=1150626 RepID=H8FSP8_MAGML|nr:O-antigen ligase family protein [Magnetospirillum molischianum]CCG41386.1 conserved membrane hypothetical protein [Magnetospirillum molischianum DSM 120]
MPSANTTIFRLLLGLVVLAPLPLGANRPASWSFAALAVGTLLLAWAALVAAGRANAPLSMSRLWPVAVPFALTLVWAALQTVTVTPQYWHHPLWNELATATAPLAAQSAITLDPAMSRTAIMRLACYGGIFWLAAQLGRERERARETARVLAVAGTIYACYGLAVYASGSETILWLDKDAYLGDLTSTFINRNAYGAYAGIGLLCCLALFVNALRHLWNSPGSLRDNADTIIVKALPFLAAAALICTALMLSHSRGAFLCSGLAILALLISLSIAKVVPPARSAAVAFVVLIVMSAIIIGNGELTFERFGNSQESNDERTAIYDLVFAAIGAAPWTGYGFGAFAPAFRSYVDTTLPLPEAVDMAHNVHLELVMDLGFPGAICLYLSLTAIIIVCLRALVLRRRDQVYPALALAVTALLGLHGMMDFSVQMPAIAMTYALILGVAFAQSFNTAKKRP